MCPGPCAPAEQINSFPLPPLSQHFHLLKAPDSTGQFRKTGGVKMERSKGHHTASLPTAPALRGDTKGVCWVLMLQTTSIGSTKQPPRLPSPGAVGQHSRQVPTAPGGPQSIPGHERCRAAAWDKACGFEEQHRGLDWAWISSALPRLGLNLLQGLFPYFP